MVITGCLHQGPGVGDLRHVGRQIEVLGTWPQTVECIFTSPCSLAGEVVNTHGPVEPDKDNIRQEPYTLPQGFTWDALDLGDRGVVSTSSLAHTC